MTRFLVDECVNQKAVRAVPATSKGFDIAYPRQYSFSGAEDIPVAKLAQQLDRVLVTSDSDFFRLGFKPGDIPQGILWLHPLRSSKLAIHGLLQKFCRHRQEQFSADPYNFQGQMIEVTHEGVHTFTITGDAFHPWPDDSSSGTGPKAYRITS